MTTDGYFVLGWPQPNGKIAILCRSKGANGGPALCYTKREAMQLRTRLANDPRGDENPTARRIIQKLFVYRYILRKPLSWRPGDLWVYLDPTYLEPAEAVFSL